MTDKACVFCGRTAKAHHVRRGLCEPCHGKLRDIGAPLPGSSKGGRPRTPLTVSLDRWLETWSPESRARLRAVLRRLEDTTDGTPTQQTP